MPKTSPSLFGKRMRAARQMTELSQDRLGVLIGLDEACSSARISRYEGGVHEPPFKTAESIAAALGVPVAYFYCPDETLAQLFLTLSRLPKPEQERLLALAQERLAGLVQVSG